MGGKFSDIGTYTAGGIFSGGQGALAISIDEMNARDVPNTIFISWNGTTLKPLGRKLVHTKFLGMDPERGGIVAVGEYGDCIAISASGTLTQESISSSGSEPATRGPLRSGTCVGGAIVVVGMDRQVYLRRPGGTWSTLEAGLSPDREAGAGYEAVTAFSPREMYAAGWGGELVAFDGRQWRSVASPTDRIIVSLAVGADGQVYGCGRNGLIVRGRHDEWEVLDKDVADDFWSVAWFQEALYLSSARGIYKLHGDSIVPVDVSVTAAETFHALSSSANALWSIGPKDVIAFDGSSWTRID
ncbi:beta propeller repeat protein [Marilutibacter alkalisoli]|uniref:WD40 repeat domain-containing protein n=1 Tax=Marilutibacter alkalisoli TaxID=2591633 RepID=A0A514BMZ8_9GAMM|nr:hypothetical protein [Lysobacter alkalisoli]QDH68705.1 hypothetical protein FKV23_00165 [Lysobacter alkalisoli]